jgi:squalene synthase HpnD
MHGLSRTVSMRNPIDDHGRASSGDDAKAHARTVTVASGSSFYWAMRLLPLARREAMFAIYAFCREVDDIADGDDPPDTKLAKLAEWRTEIDRVYDGSPTFPTARALVDPVRDHDLGRADFHAVIDGMEMDVGVGIVAPTMKELEIYCRRVAGAVGLLSIRAFGGASGRAEEFAVELGIALQLTNILRDLMQDAAIGRLYLPRELLEAHGIATTEPRRVLADPRLPDVCNDIAALARRRFDAAQSALRESPAKALRPAVVMMRHYQRILEQLEARGWRNLDREVSVPTPIKIWIALRYGLISMEA